MNSTLFSTVCCGYAGTVYGIDVSCLCISCDLASGRGGAGWARFRNKIVSIDSTSLKPSRQMQRKCGTADEVTTDHTFTM
jgi:hypothetical protein